MKASIMIKLETYEISDFSFKIQDKWDCIKLLLCIVRFFSYHYKQRAIFITKEDKLYINKSSYIKLVNESISRLYLYIGFNKYVSMVFPFNFSAKNKSNIEFFYKGNFINEELLSNMFSIIAKRKDSHSWIGQGRSSIVELYLDDDESISNQAFYILDELLSLELGYIRYDYDPVNANGRVHPEHHFDINFSKNATFKYGLNTMLSNVDFEKSFDKKSECLYLDY